MRETTLPQLDEIDQRRLDDLTSKVRDFTRLAHNNPTRWSKKLAEVKQEMEDFLDELDPSRMEERVAAQMRARARSLEREASNISAVVEYAEFCCEFDGEDEELAEQYYVAAYRAVMQKCRVKKEEAQLIVSSVITHGIALR